MGILFTYQAIMLKSDDTSYTTEEFTDLNAFKSFISTLEAKGETVYDVLMGMIDTTKV